LDAVRRRWKEEYSEIWATGKDVKLQCTEEGMKIAETIEVGIRDVTKQTTLHRFSIAYREIFTTCYQEWATSDGYADDDLRSSEKGR
jgi:hypothetical protein